MKVYDHLNNERLWSPLTLKEYGHLDNLVIEGMVGLHRRRRDVKGPPPDLDLKNQQHYIHYQPFHEWSFQQVHCHYPGKFFFIYKIAIKDGHCLEGQSKFEQLSEILTKVENILTHWSVAQTCAVLNDEKNGGRKSLWTVPLIVLFCVFTLASPCLAAVSALLRPVRPP